MSLSLHHLPGGDLIEKGLTDYAQDRVTPESCLLAIAWSRLKNAGLPLPRASLARFAEPEHQLYALLQTQPGDAYSRYNALLRRLISFHHALTRAHSISQESSSQPS